MKNFIGIAVSKIRFESSISKYKIEALQVQINAFIKHGQMSYLWPYIITNKRGNDVKNSTMRHVHMTIVAMGKQ